MKLERLKLESSSRSLKVRGEVGKFELKLESSGWNWKVQLKVLAEVPSSILAFQLHKSLSNCGETFQLQRNFQTSNETFQPWSVLSNFACFFATSLASFQLKQKLSNFRLSKLKLSNFSFFPTALSNYTYLGSPSLEPWLVSSDVPSIIDPLSSCLATSASALSSKVTNPNPFEPRSLKIISTSETVPNF